MAEADVISWAIANIRSTDVNLKARLHCLNAENLIEVWLALRPVEHASVLGPRRLPRSLL